ncbi:DUF3078 domain-containing protein [Sunxiuqinia elliptica]|uniref:DUF3078 family protein n=1 Tax=Sunxiuqinia elliptica TaxID=655355 RepID=A0A4R6GPE6_9BACT|nr:DUF3078 domain-containing protein [Sunxiuqinia elliptica]TDN96315.1 DUF3078 family protein [Sunxiuqinia elliptica]TDO68026.1 DUF3078 family protein [Sunxiuqinia elliptica]
MRHRFFLAVILLTVCCSLNVQAERDSSKRKKSQVDSVQVSVDYLKYFLEQNNNWIPRSEDLMQNLKGLVHFVEDEKIDTILNKIGRYREINDGDFFYRPTTRVADSLEVDGYVSQDEVKEQVGKMERSIRSTIVKDQIPVPEELLSDLDSKVRLLERDEAELLLRDSLVILPDSLQGFDVIPDSLISSPADFKRLQRLDSTKTALLENARLQYNNNVLQYYIDSVSEAYREEYVQQYVNTQKALFSDSIKGHNYRVLDFYNQQVMRSVNDSIARMIDVLTDYAENEEVEVWVQNSEGDSTKVILRNNGSRYARMFLKNEQKDSLGIRVINTSKNAMQIFIDDAVTLKRFSTQQTKDFNFDRFEPESNLRSIDQRYKVVTPWNLGGDGTFGFTQTAVSNWKKGGKSALSTLLVLKGFANYSYGKVKWENSVELRNGWIKPSGPIQKNDDKFEFISRFGLSAFKKWYYSAEIDFQTQLFNGYKYPDRDNKISAFMAPAKTMIKVGLDYKPNNDFSLFLSPFTSKTVYVRDTVNIDPSNFGIEAGKKRYWEPGLNADIKWKKKITHDISYQMKYKMFINYSAPFSKFDVDWENNLVMQLNDFINLRMMLHLIYDDNVKFNVGEDANGNAILEPKWQVKEFITIGFSYNFNKRVYRRERLN